MFSLPDDLIGNLLKNPVAGKLGVPQASTLRRGAALPTGEIALGSTGGELAAQTLELLGLNPIVALRDTAENRTRANGNGEEGNRQPPSYPGNVGALVLDATTVAGVDDLEQVRQLIRPVLRKLAKSGRLIVLGVDPPRLDHVEAAAAQQGLEGIVRSVAKELRFGATANLIRVADSSAADVASTLAFLLSGRSAYVDGQPIVVGSCESVPAQVTTPFAADGNIVVVTGAARGIGAAIAKAFAGHGARVIALDVPAAGEALVEVANECGAQALQLDITGERAGERIAEFVAQRYGAEAKLYAIVHNAGITRDKLLANTDEERWASVLEVNLKSQLAINAVLLDENTEGGLADGGRIVSVASTSGIAGNRGQANYAASKAGVVGLVRSLAPRLAERRITVNAVAPGFIETEMTSKIPLATREIGRRINSLNQGGLPVDVAETIAFFAEPASAAITGQVLRVCGQSELGA